MIKKNTRAKARDTHVRAFIQRLVSDRFESNVLAASKALGLGNSILYEILARKRNAGLNVIDALAEYTGETVAAIIGERPLAAVNTKREAPTPLDGDRIRIKHALDRLEGALRAARIALGSGAPFAETGDALVSIAVELAKHMAVDDAMQRRERAR